jgi:transcriptional regulator with XRE-family HTH domain
MSTATRGGLRPGWRWCTLAGMSDEQNASAIRVDTLLRAARHHADLSQRELAARAGVDRAMVSRLESGQVASPRLATVVRLLAAANVSLVPVTATGHPLPPRPYDDARDAAARRWPAHLEVREVRTWSDWWFSRMILDGRPLPKYTANWRRNAGRPRSRRRRPGRGSR